MKKLPKINVLGKKFGNWTVLKLAGYHKGSNNKSNWITWKYLAECVCGRRYKVWWSDLKSGKSKQCHECHMKSHKWPKINRINLFGPGNNNFKGKGVIPSFYYKRVESNAELRNLEFRISIDDLDKQWRKQNGRCFYTGLPLIAPSSYYTENGNEFSLMGSLDRINSKKGYTTNNIVWTSKTVNKIKMHFPSKVFIDMCKLVYKYKYLGKTSSLPTFLSKKSIKTLVKYLKRQSLYGKEKNRQRS